jgi:hypothetical protein
MVFVPVVFQQSKCRCAFCTRTISIYCQELASILVLLDLQQEVKGYISWFSCAIHIKSILSSELWSDTGSIWDREHFIQHPILSHSADCISHSLFCFPRKSLRKLIWYEIWYDIFNCNWVATRWQLFSTHIHTNNKGNITKQTIHRTTQKYIEQHKKYVEQHKNWEECGPWPIFAGITLAFALQLRKKHGKTSVRVVVHKHTVIQ